jgi:hypothetical protein
MSHEADHTSCPACGSWWRLPLLLAIVLAILLVFQSRQWREEDRPRHAAPPGADSAESSEPSPEQVQLTIDFGDGRPPLSATANWRNGMTVADLLGANEDVRIKSQGEGASTFLTELNGVANEGAGGRNWLYRVNGKHADRSLAVYELRPGDHVLWKFYAQD